MLRFIHAADIHLDSPLHKIRDRENLPQKEILGATRQALENMVTLAEMEKVDFIILAGDLYDKSPDMKTRLFFNQKMFYLNRLGIQIYMISGNHDADSLIKKKIQIPPNVHLFSSEKPETVLLDKKGFSIAIHGQSFLDKEEKKNLAANYPDPNPDRRNIGVLHTSLDGNSEHANYAPTTLLELQAKDYDYWALGHIHKREEVCKRPWVIYPGNIQGRHIKETGSKGCYLVTLDHQGKFSPEYRPLDVLRWESIEVSLAGINQEDGFLNSLQTQLTKKQLAHPEKPTILRVTFTGETPLHRQFLGDEIHLADMIQNKLNEICPDQLFLENVVLNTQPPISHADLTGVNEVALNSIENLANSFLNDKVGFENLLEETQKDKEKAKTLTGLKRLFPASFTKGTNAIRPEDPDWLQELLTGIGPLFERLSREAEPRS